MIASSWFPVGFAGPAASAYSVICGSLLCTVLSVASSVHRSVAQLVKNIPRLGFCIKQFTFYTTFAVGIHWEGVCVHWILHGCSCLCICRRIAQKQPIGLSLSGVHDVAAPSAIGCMRLCDTLTRANWGMQRFLSAKTESEERVRRWKSPPN